ncbi:hypothetical protein [Mesorhizobium sp. ORS 3428]|uniref:hypothetical protein n=1 Tax=Mesorhizobium sp. ORS 3428 TaxID=540997 RepID=UPI0008DA51DA|nr:hypothetical protein [Mesorhizobium sp. ORS 3428]OHV87918.1 hypothetical protein ORS3428_03835 [Mesorhizobium sp. ORS 3428]
MTAMSFNEALQKESIEKRKQRIDAAIELEKAAAADRAAFAKIIKRAGDPAETGEVAMDPHKAFDDAVAAIHKRDGGTPLSAITKALAEHPDLAEASMKAPPPAPKVDKRADDTRTLAIAKSAKTIDDLAAEIQRPGETFAKAYVRALEENPHLYTNYAAARAV